MRFNLIAKKGLAAVMAVMMVLAFTACNNSKKNSSAASNKNVTLQFQQWWEEELPQGDLLSLCNAYTQKTGVKIKLLSNPYADTKTQITAGAASGTMADVVGIDGSWVYDFVKQGAISDLSALMTKDNYDTTQLASQLKINGKTYMIPVVNFAYPMYVNMDLLNAAGIKTVPKTWTEFSADCNAVTNKNKNVYGWIIELSPDSPSGIQNCFMSWLWASGGSMLNNGKPGLTNNDKLTKTTDFVKSLFSAGVVTPGASSMTEADMVEEFSNGRVAFMTDSLAHLVTIKTGAPNLHFDIMDVPKMDGYTGKSGMDVATWGIGVSSNSKYQAQSMKFIEYLMDSQVNSKLAVYANAFPGNSKATPDYSASDAAFKSAYTIYQSCTPINEFTGLPTSEDLMRSFGNELQLYINGKVSSANDMLSTVQGEWGKAFK